jgi:hypothetical protein
MGETHRSPARLRAHLSTALEINGKDELGKLKAETKNRLILPFSAFSLD